MATQQTSLAAILYLLAGIAGEMSKSCRHPPCVVQHQLFLICVALASCVCTCRAGAFALGLATTLALLGVLSSAVGNAYGQIGDALPLGAGGQAACSATTALHAAQHYILGFRISVPHDHDATTFAT